MAPEGFGEFFLASAGTGGAFVGLLFVAISIGPQRTFGDAADLDAPRQHLAEATFLTLANGFVVSSIALIPTINVGWVALGGGIWGFATAIHLSWRFARFHCHGDRRRWPWRHPLRAASLSLVATVVYALEGLLGLRLALHPSDAAAFGWLAVVIVGLYALAILRAWTLLGDPQHGWSGWFNPLLDPAPRGAVQDRSLPPDPGVGHHRQRVVPAPGEVDHLARGDDPADDGGNGHDADADVEQPGRRGA
jgi:hypothetical protein